MATQQDTPYPELTARLIEEFLDSQQRGHAGVTQQQQAADGASHRS